MKFTLTFADPVTRNACYLSTVAVSSSLAVSTLKSLGILRLIYIKPETLFYFHAVFDKFFQNKPQSRVVTLRRI